MAKFTRMVIAQTLGASDIRSFWSCKIAWIGWTIAGFLRALARSCHRRWMAGSTCSCQHPDATAGMFWCWKEWSRAGRSTRTPSTALSIMTVHNRLPFELVVINQCRSCHSSLSFDAFPNTFSTLIFGCIRLILTASCRAVASVGWRRTTDLNRRQGHYCYNLFFLVVFVAFVAVVD